MKQISTFFLTVTLLTPAFVGSFGGAAPVLIIQATVTGIDGSQTELDDFRVNGNTEIMVYSKPADIKNNGENDVSLSIDPHGNRTGPMHLSNIKTITVAKPPVTYIYQEKNGATKNHFCEIMVDGISYLVQKNWTVTGIDKKTNQKKSMDFPIVDKITGYR